jgi:hypothetical protein
MLTKWALGTYYKEGMEYNLGLIDALLQCSVIDRDLSTPPGSPANGDAYIVGATATGAWAAKENHIAVWNTVNNAWAFYEPQEGWCCFVKDEKAVVDYRASSWEIDYATFNMRNVAVIDIADADYTLTEAETLAGLKAIINSGTTQRTITIPTSTDAICGTQHQFSLVYCNSNIEVISETGGSPAIILAGSAVENIAYYAGTASVSHGDAYAKKANAKANGYSPQTATTYTPDLTDLGKVVSMNHASASTLTLATEASAGWHDDCKMIIRSGGAAGLTIAASGGVTLIGVTSLTTNQIVTAYYTGSDTWVIG